MSAVKDIITGHSSHSYIGKFRVETTAVVIINRKYALCARLTAISQ